MKKIKKIAVLAAMSCGFTLAASPALAVKSDLASVPAPTITKPYEFPFDYLKKSSLPSEGKKALAYLKTLTAIERDSKADGTYNRKAMYGTPWKDTDGNHCDTRNDILARDFLKGTIDYNKDLKGIQGLNNPSKGKSTCRYATVYAGVLVDPYRYGLPDPGPKDKMAYKQYFKHGKVHFNQVKGASAVQIDHVIPLKYHYSHGGVALQQAGRKDIAQVFANDPLNLLAVFGPENMKKSDSGPADYLPPTKDKETQCRYALRVTAVTKKYNPFGFSLAQRDIDATAKSIQTNCLK